MSSQESFSINAAAKLTGYSLPTVRKRLQALEKAGAVQQGGRWAIPLSALHAVGLMSRVEGESKPLASEVTPQPLQGETIKEIDNLRAQLSEALQRAAVAEAVAQERAEALQRADRALLALEASKGSRFRLFNR